MLETADLNPMISRAFLVGVESPGMSETEAEGLLDELSELVNNLGIGEAGRASVRLREPKAAYYLGEGKTDEILALAAAVQADSIIFDEPLSPAQQRNWDRRAGGKLLIIDRQEVILDIFNSRAQTREARLQVELARLEYELPRMKRAWSHLDRQRGGGAVQRDAGETQLEMDQRLIRTRISRLKRELSDVSSRREVQRRQRERVPLPTAAIVGYTNAGKSTLLNRLCAKAEVLAADKLFATLDPTTRRCRLPDGQTLLLTDTVGFIRRLPHRLVEAFKATLEEALLADVLVQVIDASSPDVEHHLNTTNRVLAELGAEDKARILVANKIDQVNDPGVLDILRHAHPDIVLTSAHQGDGLPELLQRCAEAIANYAEPQRLLLPHDRYDLLHRLHQAGAVTDSEVRDDGLLLHGHIPPRLAHEVAPYLCQNP